MELSHSLASFVAPFLETYHFTEDVVFGPQFYELSVKGRICLPCFTIEVTNTFV